MGQYQGGEKVLVGHRGASAYAPEHTLDSYRLAIEQGVDFVEQDLQITRDGILVCLHDATLERTTNVEEVFPERFRQEGVRKRWFVSDFSLDEVRQLDAGSWFDPRFKGVRVPTFREAIELVKGQAGLFPETKNPADYKEMGFSMEALLLEDLRAFGLERAGAVPRTPVIVQSFSEESLKILRGRLGSDLPLVFLIGERDRDRWASPEGLAEVKKFADGIGPSKSLLLQDGQLTASAHAVGLSVTPYTFRSASVPPEFDNVKSEMFHFLFEIGVDALFTDNPDLFPRE